jgi:hypothetical protein
VVLPKVLPTGFKNEITKYSKSNASPENSIQLRQAKANRKIKYHHHMAQSNQTNCSNSQKVLTHNETISQPTGDHLGKIVT